jgi:hypothetical protein
LVLGVIGWKRIDGYSHEWSGVVMIGQEV